MKLLLTISLGLLAFSLRALSWPVKEDMLESFTLPDTDTISKIETQQENMDDNLQGEGLFMCLTAVTHFLLLSVSPIV